MSENKNEKKTLVDYWLQKSESCLESAKRELNAGALEFAVNRLYYSLFYSVTAALTAKGEQQKLRKHSAVQAAFYRDFVRPGIVDLKYGKLYKRLFNDRHQADYTPMATFDRDEVEQMLQQVEEFIPQLKKIIINLI